jgi:hypothetical protein
VTAGYPVLSGQAPRSLRDEDGRYVPLEVIEGGEYFGAEALATGEPRQMNARALTAVKLIEETIPIHGHVAAGNANLALMASVTDITGKAQPALIHEKEKTSNMPCPWFGMVSPLGGLHTLWGE